MTGSRKIMALLGAMLVLLLAGCVRFQADLSVAEDDTLDGDIVVAVVSDHEPGSDDNARENAGKIEAQLLPALRGATGVTAEVYEQDDYLGTRFTLSDTPIEALAGGENGALSLTRSGDRFEFSGTLDFTPGDEPAEDTGDPADSGIEVSISFPGDVLDHNGELSGNTVTWTTTLEGSVDMHATASAIPSGPPAWVFAVAGGAVLVVVVVIVLLVVRGRRSLS
jgi:hypothetical protein